MSRELLRPIICAVAGVVAMILYVVGEWLNQPAFFFGGGLLICAAILVSMALERPRS